MDWREKVALTSVELALHMGSMVEIAKADLLRG